MTRLKLAIFPCLVLALTPTLACQSTQASPNAGQSEVEAALRHYAELVLAMNHAGIAALFDAEGEIVHEGQGAIRGRMAIEKFLAGFSAYTVLENSTLPTSTVVHGDTADQTGTYHQKVRTPEGQEVEVSGTFHAEWRKSGSGQWLIRRMGTSAAN